MWAGSSAAHFSQATSNEPSSNWASGRSFSLPNFTLTGTALSVCGWYQAPVDSTPTWAGTRSNEKVFDFAVSGSGGSNVLLGHGGNFNYIAGQWQNGATVLGGASYANMYYAPLVWVHFCSVASGTSGYIYLQGIPNPLNWYTAGVPIALSAAITPGVVRASNYIGRSHVDTDSLFQGVIDELRIYPHALTQAEVSAIHSYTGSMTTAVMPVLCPAGSFSASANASACLICAAGSFSSTGASGCTSCDVNTFSVTGSSACAACPVGSTSANGSTACVAVAGYYDLGQSLMAYYTFDAANMLADHASSPLGALTASTKPPTLTTGAWTGSLAARLSQVGSNGQSSDFANGQSFRLPNLPPNITVPTVCMWIKPVSVAANHFERVLDMSWDGAAGRYAIFTLNDWELYFGYPADASHGRTRNENNFAYSSTSTWIHVCTMIKADGIRWWCGNGVCNYGGYDPVSTCSNIVTDPSNPYNYLGRGSAQNDESRLWGGDMDEVRMYPRALSPAEVSAIYDYRGSVTTAVMPVLCPAGSFSASANASACSLCSAGTYSATVGASTCGGDACPAGSYGTGLGETSVLACTLCGTGNYSAIVGATTCAGCQAGSYGTGSGFQGCTLCGMGTYGTGTGGVSVLACTLCGTGNYSATVGASTPATCTNCQAGSYGTGSGFQDCTLCGAGSYSSVVGASTPGTCTDCPAGSYATGVGYPVCTLCEAGTFSGSEGESSSCLSCPVGWYSVSPGEISSGACTLCPVGEYCATVGTGPVACEGMPANGYWLSTGTTSSNCQWACSL